MAQIRDVANYLIYLKERSAKFGEFYSLSNLKLQKLLYYCQATKYQKDQAPLIQDDVFEAWPYGPVVPEIYREFREFGSNEITLNSEVNFNLKEDEKNIIEDVWGKLAPFDAYTLVELTHEEDPWKNAIETTEKKITNNSIYAYFNQHRKENF